MKTKLEKGVSLCMIARNEEAMLARALDSVRSFVDEIILVDTGSTDRTIDIAKDFGAKIESFTWNDDFSAARNRCLELAGREWILVLDGDESISERGIFKLKNLLDQGTACLYRLIQTTYTFRSEMVGYIVNRLDDSPSLGYPGYFESKLVRFFRNRRQFRFSGIIHEHCVDLSGEEKPLDSDVRIHHFGKVLAEDDRRRSKIDLYLNIGEKKVALDDTFQSHYELAMQYWEAGRLDDAVAAFNKALRRKEDSTRTLMMLGGIEMEKGRYEQALSYLDKAASIDRNDRLIPVLRSTCLIELGRLGQVKGLLVSAIKNDPGNFLAFNNLGVLYLVQNNVERALYYFNRAREIGGDQENVLINIGLVYIQRGEFDNLGRIERRISELYSDSQVKFTIWGRALLIANKLDLLSKLFVNFPESCDYFVHYLAGMVSFTKGDRIEAQKRFKASLEAKPDFVAAGLMVTRLNGSEEDRDG